MKSIKKTLSLLLSVLMLLSLSLTAVFAADSYTISINNAVMGQTYRAYKIFDATHYGDNVAYTISTESKWYPIMVNYRQGERESAYNPFTFTPSAADATVMVVTATPNKTLEAATLAQYLNGKLHTAGPFTAAATKTAEGTSVTLNVTGSGEGYYFVDTSLGALCSLDTVTGTNIEIYEKNTAPTLAKTVQEDSTGDYGATATADMNQDVNFRLTVTTGTDSSELEGDYVITDTLPGGMDYKTGTLTVKNGGTTWTANTHYTFVYNTENDNHVLTITLPETNVEALGANATIVIDYQATVNHGAVVKGEGNTNTAKLTYLDYETDNLSATVYTHEIGGTDDNGNPIFKKVDGATKEPLAGVKFILSKDVEVNGTPTTYYANLDSGYKLNRWTVDKSEATAIVTGDNGGFLVQGLDADTYILTETETLPGYNLLTDTITVVITEEGNVTYNMTSAGEDDAGTTITVENNTGTTIPSTGGMGTTIFYVIGSVLVVSAGVLLIVKKRMKGVE